MTFTHHHGDEVRRLDQRHADRPERPGPLSDEQVNSVRAALRYNLPNLGHARIDHVLDKIRRAHPDVGMETLAAYVGEALRKGPQNRYALSWQVEHEGALIEEIAGRFESRDRVDRHIRTIWGEEYGFERLPDALRLWEWNKTAGRWSRVGRTG